MGRFRIRLTPSSSVGVRVFKRMLGVGVLAAGVVAALSGCEVNQIDWINHQYVVSSACAPAPLTPGATTLHDYVGYIGTPGTRSATRVAFLNVQYGDLTHDGIEDAAVLLECNDTVGGNVHGDEVQVFTRDGQPVERLVAPHKYPGASYAPYFGSIQTVDNALYTTVAGYLPGDSKDSPSAHDTYRWDWNGHGFTPVDVSTQMRLGAAGLTLPAGWVAEPLVSTANSHPIVPTWCLMPHSAPTPASPDSAGCTIAFKALPTGAASPEISVSTPGGLVGNPEYCNPAQSQTVSLVTQQLRPFGIRLSDYRDWLYSCADGTRWPIEQYVASAAPAFVLYSSHATPAVHSVITQIARTASLPPTTTP